MISMEIFKVSVLVLCLVSTLIGILASSFMEGHRRSLALGQSFTAGVLLAAGLVHMLPDAERVLTHELKSSFPLAHAIAGFVFCLLPIVQEMALACASLTSTGCCALATATPTALSQAVTGGHSQKLLLPLLKRDVRDPAHPVGPSSLPSSSDNQLAKMPLGKAIALFAALGFHSVMEGMGLGSALQSQQVLSISAALLSHKVLDGFAMGSALRRLSSVRFAVLAAIFAAATPLGGMLSWYLAGSSQGVWLGLCSAAAAGTFLQVATCELMPSALLSASAARERVQCCCVIILGFVLFSTLAFWI